MRRKICGIFLFPLLLLCTGCSSRQPSGGAVLAGVIFERGHDSMWGDQFYIEVSENQIDTLRCIGGSDAELQEYTQLPITRAEWRQITSAAHGLIPELETEKEPGFFEKLFGGSFEKTDGTGWKKLKLIWRTGAQKETISYIWPDGAAAGKLETLLLELAENNIPNE